MKKKRERVGFFGGTFDPPHNGHIHLALSLIESKKVDAVIFCPAGLSPFKRHAPPQASNEDRLKMVALAIEPISEFSLLDWETKQRAPSYTIDTVRFLIARDEKAKNKVTYRLILGEDAFTGFSKWKEADVLIQLAPPLVGSREQKLPRKKTAVELVKLPLLDISSTEIRKRLKEGRYSGHLLPPKVLDYIYKNKLYTE